jgi:cobyrinic acid a,c-diamide synthase
MFPALKESIEAHTGIQVLGYMPNLPEASIESRHLGLVTAAEIDSLSQKVDMLADCAGRTIDLEAIIAIAQSAPPLSFTTPKIEKGRPVRIALAKDRAFCFIYQDSIDLLAEMGAEIVPFSPLTDACLPSHMDGILLYGGYPELYAEELSRNTSMRNSIRQAISQGIPTYAECGGFMYLGTSIRDTEGKDYPMVGAFDNRSELTDRLQNFGYVELTAQEDTLLCYKGDQIHAHEFHYAKSDDNGNAFIAVKTSNGKENRCILSRGTVFGGYPHLHFWGNPRFAAGFLSKCRQFSESRF